MKHAIILSITSDIGFDIAKRLSNDGYAVTGTYRSLNGYDKVKEALPAANLIKCDISNHRDIKNAILLLKRLPKWDLFISCPCDPLPLKSFYESDIDQWQSSFNLNSLNQLRFLHGIYQLINKKNSPTVLFFAGGGTNSAVINFSAYTSAKIHLIKMMELLAFEDQETRYLILGPGWTNTKTHNISLSNTPVNSKKYKEIKAFMKNPSSGTSMQEIYECITSLLSLPADVVSGRNFSIVNDLWSPPYQSLLEKKLRSNPDLYKLRRFGNDIFPSLKEIARPNKKDIPLGRQINLMKHYPIKKRPIETRLKSKQINFDDVGMSYYGNFVNDILFQQLLESTTKSFDADYFDGDRNQGYGGYKYDKKYWFNVAKDIISTYDLKSGHTVLEIGCAKGFLLHDLLELCPGLKIKGIDISDYAVSHALPNVKKNIAVHNASELPFPNKTFDLVLCINTLSELPFNLCKEAITEISRVSKGQSFITLNSWRNEIEKIQLEKWNLSALSNFNTQNWMKILHDLDYRGDYYWNFIK